MTAYLQLPSGTTAQRPTGANGMMRYNESESKTEIYQDSDWKSIDTTGYSYAIQYVVVAGGGAGGTGAFGDAAGGAGGGGYYGSSGNGANGGSGVVMLKIPTASYSGTTTGSPAVTTVGDYKIIRFTSSGSYTG